MCTLEEKEKESKMRTQTVRYRVYEEWITHPQLGRYCCYGIVCESYLPKHGWQLQQAVSDITDDRNAAEALAALMQQEDLEPCHLLGCSGGLPEWHVSHSKRKTPSTGSMPGWCLSFYPLQCTSTGRRLRCFASSTPL